MRRFPLQQVYGALLLVGGLVLGLQVAHGTGRLFGRPLLIELHQVVRTSVSGSVAGQP